MCASAFGIEFINASLQYHDSPSPVLANINLAIPAQQWTVLLGRSGCGKTTLLRYLAGLLEGQVQWQGHINVTQSDEQDDNLKASEHIAYMAQQDLLLPWLNVLDNVCLSTRFSHSPTSHAHTHMAHHRQRALSLLEQVGLAQCAYLTPDQLSGGMRQRVALARTLMQDQPLVLMDEPFSALDAVTRYKLQGLAAQLLADKTVVLITHDPQEAVRLAERLYVLQGMPAQALRLAVPSSHIPRSMDYECAALQQTILQQLENDYE